MDSVAADAFKAGMRRLAAGVTIVAAESRGVRGGLTATSVCSLTADPPQLLACVSRSAAAHDLIAASGAFSINLLARRHQALAARFAGQDGVFGPERFDEGDWRPGATGAPMLVDAIAGFACRVRERVPASTHTVFFGLVVDVRLRERGRPLLYAAGAFTGLAAPRRRARATA